MGPAGPWDYSQWTASTAFCCDGLCPELASCQVVAGFVDVWGFLCPYTLPRISEPKAAIRPAASRLATCFCFASRCHLLPCVPPEVWNCGEEGSGAAMLRDSPLSSDSSVVLSCSLGGHDSRVTQGPYKTKGSWCLSWAEFLLPDLPSLLRSLHYWRSCTTMLPYSSLDGPYC